MNKNNNFIKEIFTKEGKVWLVNGVIYPTKQKAEMAASLIRLCYKTYKNK